MVVFQEFPIRVGDVEHPTGRGCRSLRSTKTDTCLLVYNPHHRQMAILIGSIDRVTLDARAHATRQDDGMSRARGRLA